MKYVLVLALWFGLNCHARIIEGQVVGVADGDTITVLDGEKVRHKIQLSGIDATEKKQDFGSRSKQSLSDLVFEKAVAVEIDKTDRYGRAVGTVLVNGLDANLEQLQRGFAWHYKAYQREQSAKNRKLYDFAESTARAARRGLWRDANPEPPWDYRQQRRKPSVIDTLN